MVGLLVVVSVVGLLTDKDDGLLRPDEQWLYNSKSSPLPPMIFLCYLLFVICLSESLSLFTDRRL